MKKILNIIKGIFEYPLTIIAVLFLFMSTLLLLGPKGIFNLIMKLKDNFKDGLKKGEMYND